MATNTYVALQTQTLGSAAASVTFSSISQAYTDLVIQVNGYTSYSGVDAAYVFFNGDNLSSNYSVTRLYGNGTSASSDRYSAPYNIWMGNAYGQATINVQNYSNSTTYKTTLSRSGALGAAGITGATAVLWRNTAAITSISIQDVSGNWQAGSTFTLYGIAAA